jgi:hypothetical protein
MAQNKAAVAAVRKNLLLAKLTPAQPNNIVIQLLRIQGSSVVFKQSHNVLLSQVKGQGVEIAYVDYYSTGLLSHCHVLQST